MMSPSELKEKTRKLAPTLLCLGEPHRLLILSWLYQESHPITATDISLKLGIPVTNICRHLKILETERLVVSWKTGRERYYTVSTALTLCSDVSSLLSSKTELGLSLS